MDRNFYRYIWQNSKREQIAVLTVVALSMPVYFVGLLLPKFIVDGPILGKGFEDAMEPFLRLTLPLPEVLGGTLVLFEGIALERVPMLAALCAAFAGLVIANGLFKMRINTMKGRMGERMLRRLRYDIVDRVLRFPQGALRRAKPGEVASMVKDEVEPVGGFVGDAFVLPAFLAGQSLTAILFILVQDVWLGAIAVAGVATQVAVIPPMRRKLVELGRRRQLEARWLSGRVAEIVEAAPLIRANATGFWERADVVGRLAQIYDTRLELYQRKFFVKFLNNLIAQGPPLIFYGLGGYLVINGDLAVGALVAVIAAYRDIPQPIRDLIAWDHQRIDVETKYETVVSNFLIDGLRAQEEAGAPIALPASVAVRAHGITLRDDTGVRLLNEAHFTIGPGEHVALTGDVAEGKEAVGPLLARLAEPERGTLKLGETGLETLCDGALGQVVGYAGHEPHLFSGSVRDNLAYALRRRPCFAEARAREEALKAGNPPFDRNGDWIDLGADGAGGLDRRLIDAAAIAGLDDEIYRLGLMTPLGEDADLAGIVMEARTALRARLAEDGAQDAIETFDPGRYTVNATLGENLIFGAPLDARLDPQRLLDAGEARAIIRTGGLDEPLLEAGAAIGATMIELFQGLPAGHPFFEQFSFVPADELPALAQRLSRRQTGGLMLNDRLALQRLALGYVDARHRLGVLTDDLKARVVAARAAFHRQFATAGGIAPYDPERASPALPVIDNVLFGRVAYGRAGAQERVDRLVREALAGAGLAEALRIKGLGFDVGVAGRRLSTATRQRLALARIAAKRPAILIVDDALSALARAQQAEVIEAVRAAFRGSTVIWRLSDPRLARRFQRVLVFEQGRVIQDGSYGELAGTDGRFAELLAEDGEDA